MPLDNADKMILGLQLGESLAPSQGCERLPPGTTLSSNIICTVRVSDESVVEGEYDRPGVSGLGLSVMTGIGENCNPQGSSGNFED
jgi:hypothetical protein